jgi:hypothetical protein
MKKLLRWTDGGVVGGAHLAQPRSAGFEDFRDPKSAADLNEFTARNDYFVLPRSCFAPPFADALPGNGVGLFAKVAQNQYQGCRIVVHHGGGFSGTQKRERPLKIRGSTPARSTCEVVFKIVVTGPDYFQFLDHRRAQGSTPKIRMYENPSAVNHGLNAAGG